MRKAPSIPTIKSLFALSGNLCAYPNCAEALIGEDGAVLAEICHIEAAEVGGERYNPRQTDEERRSFANLIVLCRKHHVVTNNEDVYTVTKLKQMKSDHESKYKDGGFSISESNAKVLQGISISNNISVNNSHGANVLGIGEQHITQTFNFPAMDYEQELTVIDEIFKYVIDNVTSSVLVQVPDLLLLSINEKIELNFKNEDEQEEISQYFRLAYLKISGIEARFKALDINQQSDIQNHVLGCYKRLKHKGMQNIEIIHKLFEEFTPNGKGGDPKYTSLAKAFVLIFFEDCTIFEKVKKPKKGNT